MRTSTRSIRTFNVRCRPGSVTPAAACFSSGMLAEEHGHYEAVSDEAVIAAALRILSRQLVRGGVMGNPRIVREYFAMRFAGLEHEVFACLYLDARNRVIACEDLFRGTIDASIVHVREVVKQVLAHNAAAVIFAHNHPSGVPEPSWSDELITRRLKDVLAIIDVRVLDHLIVAGAAIESMAQRGLL